MLLFLIKIWFLGSVSYNLLELTNTRYFKFLMERTWVLESNLVLNIGSHTH